MSICMVYRLYYKGTTHHLFRVPFTKTLCPWTLSTGLMMKSLL